ncbi:bifunctional glycosyltransferase/CDP-glycerol:glycerophosphate glycerophosphotransferase [Arthrobacter gandavensis]|nr:glycosyltransferase [Arthrobacter gandavensis]
MSKGLFSIVVALYGVEEYVDTFFRSLERQTYNFEDLDVIIVDDGSTDGSYDIVKTWAKKYPKVIRHTTKDNGGPASARNIGIEMANNEWVTFCDPDDALQAEYFERVASFISRDTEDRASMLTTRVMIWQEETAKISDTHPLAAKYFLGEKLVDLNLEPNYVQLGGASTFLRNAVIKSHNLRLDERIKPTFEDAELIGRYLGKFEQPIVGLVSSARYLYRKRGNGSSLVQSSWGQLERYDEVLRYGYLGLLKDLSTHLGHVPRWAQNMVLYDLQWYLTEDKKMNSSSAWIPKESLDLFHSLLLEIFSYIDREAIQEYNITSMSWITRTAMLIHFKGQGVRLQPVVNWSDKSGHTVKLGYGYSGNLPIEEFEINGTSVTPTKSKSVAHSYYGVVFFYERMVWLPRNGRISVRLDSHPAKISPAGPPRWDRKRNQSASLILAPVASQLPLGNKLEERVPLISKIPAVPRTLSRAELVARKLENRIRIEQLLTASAAPQAVLNIGRRVVRRRFDAKRETHERAADANIIAFATSAGATAKFKDSWLIMDRPNSADDNGEHLYRYIANERPDINAWFLLDRSSPDWKRLEEEGFRLVALDSKEAVALSLNAAYKISSDATFDVQFPVPPSRFGTGRGKIVFLQHGITKDDLSRWLNPKPISMIATATVQEYNSIASDDSPYRYSGTETKLTGFPRFDELLRKSRLNPVGVRPYLLVMPTWRQGLKTEMEACSTYKERLAVFESSLYGRSWLELLRSPVLMEAAARMDLEIVFVMHPSLSAFMYDISLPAHVRMIRPAEISLQDLFSQTKLAITDYSSVAFDIALTGSSVLYYQFDQSEIFNGKHNYRKGYFDYEKDGFGPVAQDLSQVEAVLQACTETNFNSMASYKARVTHTFAFIDTDNCKRVVEAILSI